ncbi:uncharacterized protein LOC128278608 [Anopheles cruzii]|uniref:uncharacterized protein LOC128278608 n=1 Tax=Anopheles cruzii TaxID=68878 RepID=UPI0022EC891F|nr:uncharacterized protein LOC128278608 [Anopheles cruzii]
MDAVRDIRSMGCGPSNGAVPVAGEGISTISKLVYPRPEAFEVPLGDPENPDGIIKKHPPKRLKRLEEQSSSTNSLEDLEEKLATAEIRRQQFLANRSQKTTFDKDATDNDASTIPDEGEDDRSDDGREGFDRDADADSGVDGSAPQDIPGARRNRSRGRRRRPSDEMDLDEERGRLEQVDQQRRGSDLSVGHLASMKMKMKRFRKKPHQQ